MRGARAHTPYLASVFSCLLAWSLSLASMISALPSRECVKAVAAISPKDYLERCSAPPCGSLFPSFNPAQLSPLSRFQQRLSPDCQATMSKYHRPRGPATPAEAKPPWCSSSPRNSFPTNPIVFQNDVTETFALCSASKRATTFLRPLLLEVVHYPRRDYTQPASTKPHSPYPTLWHYNSSDLPPGGLPPTFMVSQNPFSRVLGAYLSNTFPKPSANRPLAEKATLQRLQAQSRTPEGFELFVRIVNITTRDARHLPRGLQPMSTMCGLKLLHYDYVLKLEELACWFPCLARGLQLDTFVRGGWHESLLGGSGSAGARWKPGGGGNCFYKPKGTTCERYLRAGEEDEEDDDVYSSGVDCASHAVHGDVSDLLEKFYTETSKEVVQRLYKRDFELFGYSV